ncbi:CS1 type fimbrial major subunit [Serratia fonticola]|uniref:CS1 type fimbrial major subunit n=1 Tax=Serratia fonticola TaxID=47917 RepID=UPI0003AEBC74|nr:CS1 type fimbrial major subunit [Serratia fonticola]ERK09879.1 Alpha-fimbriae major subunit [Serratia fonticola AU-AP2C]CAI1243202.1 Colonization factor antigen I subunit B [Serratia fonticola]
MKKIQIKTIVAGIAMLTAMSAAAVQQEITVTADIDQTVSFSQANGDPLPTSVKMGFTAGKGLTAYKQDVKLWSNAVSKDLQVSLGNAPQLTDTNGQNAVPLVVSLNGTTLSTAVSKFAYATIFPGGITNGSISMPLVISQKDAAQAAVAGRYSGMVSLILTQATTTGAGS